VSMEHTAGREAAVSTAFRQPQRGSLAGAGESLLDRTGSWKASGRPALEGPARGETSGREHRSNALMLINSRVSKEV
jgi:hypothetical protein